MVLANPVTMDEITSPSTLGARAGDPSIGSPRRPRTGGPRQTRIAVPTGSSRPITAGGQDAGRGSGRLRHGLR